ncbi:ribosome biogenesis protein BOP1 homolog [Elaeis guineensis]|uniref:ribosome biogenesis protein BOP1 homolog n=1 Tax=Elaeis guineensis var. tenera TaxID=51953 RepID=UPI003C6D1F3E
MAKSRAPSKKKAEDVEPEEPEEPSENGFVTEFGDQEEESGRSAAVVLSENGGSSGEGEEDREDDGEIRWSAEESDSSDNEVVQYVRAIRKGLIKFDKPKEEPRFYLLWGDDSSAAENERHGLSYIAAPKPKLAGHEESYNPSVEYIPTQEYESLRSVPAYENALKDLIDINIDPESLKPKLPSKKDLKPYPLTCYLEYRGHSGPVNSISMAVSGQWIASGSTDGTVRVWEAETGRCLGVWDVGEALQHVAWNLLPELPILAVSAGHEVHLLNTGLGDAEGKMRIKGLFHVEESILTDDAGNSTSVVSWVRHEKHDGIMLTHLKTVSTVEWHRKGDYFTTVMPNICIHCGMLGSAFTLAFGILEPVAIFANWPYQDPWHDLDLSCPNPVRPNGTESTKRLDWPKGRRRWIGCPCRPVRERVEVLIAVVPSMEGGGREPWGTMVEGKGGFGGRDNGGWLLSPWMLGGGQLEPGLREVSSIAIHPGGDNVIVGSKEGKMCWFDMGLSSQPYKRLPLYYYLLQMSVA